jgi:hypothetical protein
MTNSVHTHMDSGNTDRPHPGRRTWPTANGKSIMRSLADKRRSSGFGCRVVGQTRHHVGSDAARAQYGCPFGSRKRTPAPVTFLINTIPAAHRRTAIPGPSRDASTLLQLHPRSTLAGCSGQSEHKSRFIFCGFPFPRLGRFEPNAEHDFLRAEASHRGRFYLTHKLVSTISI